MCPCLVKRNIRKQKEKELEDNENYKEKMKAIIDEIKKDEKVTCQRLAQYYKEYDRITALNNRNFKDYNIDVEIKKPENSDEETEDKNY